MASSLKIEGEAREPGPGRAASGELSKSYQLTSVFIMSGLKSCSPETLEHTRTVACSARTSLRAELLDIRHGIHAFAGQATVDAGAKLHAGRASKVASCP